MIPDSSDQESDKIVAPFIAVSRHRLGIDGDGVTTLVAFQGCPLRCRYCLNIRCWDTDSIKYTLMPEELYEKVKIDDLYFRATSGGICFGGGEPALYYKFIQKFKEIIPSYWKITIETSLNVPTENIEPLLEVVDYWIVDIKDMDPETYLRYTTKDNSHVIKNLQILAENKARCQIRIPIIPQFNSKEQCEKSIEKLREMGFEKFDTFNYVIRNPKPKTETNSKRQS